MPLASVSSSGLYLHLFATLDYELQRAVVAHNCQVIRSTWCPMPLGMRAVRFAVRVAFVALTFRTTAVRSQSPDLGALQSEVLELRSLSDFFTCDCSESYPEVSTSSWCHCSNPFILPRQFAAEPSASYGREWLNYSRGFTCSGGTETALGAEGQDDPHCDFVHTFQPLERPTNVDGDQGQDIGDVAQHFFVSRSTDAGAAPTGPYWTQTNANGTLSNLQKAVPTNARPGEEGLTSVASKMFVNTWWFQHRQFTQPDSHMAVLEARTLVHADTGAPTVRFSLSTGTPSSGLNNSQEVSELRVTDTMELPGVLLGSDSSFALSDQLTFIDVKHISTPRSDNETALVPDRVFFVPVGFHSDWNSRTGFANVSTSALLLLRVLWDVADTTPGSASHSDEGSATNEFRATFDTDILLWVCIVKHLLRVLIYLREPFGPFSSMWNIIGIHLPTVNDV